MKPNFSYTPFFMVAYPATFLYFKSLVLNIKRYNFKEILHFILPIFVGSINQINNNYNFLGDYSSLIFLIFFILFSLFYTFSSFVLLKKQIWNQNSKIGLIDKQNNLIYKWTLILFSITFIVTLRNYFSIYYEFHHERFLAGKNFLWISGLLWIIIFLYLLCNPDIFLGFNALYKKIELQKNKTFSLLEVWILNHDVEINNKQDELLKEKIVPDLLNNLKEIENLVLFKKCFRNQKITQKEIAENLNIPKSHVNFIFKYHSKISFNEFKKIIRVYDAINLIESGYLKLNTLNALAEKVGFSSYNPFFTSFKEITGLNPHQYIKELQFK
ncbi:helix-turn-helix domain-containing protein [Flavobacterium chungnamense]|uniref:helix-turn-helix domain-containing protein n=1 Tax=Flavobacterium chungnamense TaxID=706182 RepID=UPI0031F05ABB